MAQIGIAVGIPFGGRLVHPKWAMCLKTIDFPVNTQQIMITVEGQDVTTARNQIVKTAKEQNARFLLFIDDDVLIPREAVQALGYILSQSDDNTMVSTGIYCTKTYIPEPVIYRDDTPGAFWDWTLNQIFEVDACGAGCMMIDMKVFDHLEEPYFRTVEEYKEINGDQVLTAVSEDIYFCRSVRKAGFKIKAHGAIVCPHYDEFKKKFFTLPEDSLPVKRETARQNAVVESQKLVTKE